MRFPVRPQNLSRRFRTPSSKSVKQRRARPVFRCRTFSNASSCQTFRNASSMPSVAFSGARPLQPAGSADIYCGAGCSGPRKAHFLHLLVQFGGFFLGGSAGHERWLWINESFPCPLYRDLPFFDPGRFFSTHYRQGQGSVLLEEHLVGLWSGEHPAADVWVVSLALRIGCVEHRRRNPSVRKRRERRSTFWNAFFPTGHDLGATSVIVGLQLVVSSFHVWSMS